MYFSAHSVIVNIEVPDHYDICVRSVPGKNLEDWYLCFLSDVM